MADSSLPPACPQIPLASQGEERAFPPSHSKWYQNCIATGNANAQYGDTYRTVNVAGDLIYVTKHTSTQIKAKQRLSTREANTASRSTSGPPRESTFPDVFSTCVAHFELIQRDHCSEPEHRLVDTLLNNLEARFTAWGRACGLDEAVWYNGALEDLETGTRVLETITCMVELFRQREKYGLIPSDQADTPAMSRANGVIWRRRFQWPPFLRGGAASPTSDTLSKIQDPEKFGRLIKSLKRLIEDLEGFTKELDISRRQRQIIIDGIDSLSDIGTLERIEMARLDGEDTVGDAASIRLRHIRAVKGSDQASASAMSTHETFFSALGQQQSDRLVTTSTPTLASSTETVAALDLESQNKRVVANLFHRSRRADQAVAIDTSNVGKTIAQTRIGDSDAIQRLPKELRGFIDKTRKSGGTWDHAQKIVYVHLVRIDREGPDYISIAPAEDSLLDLIGSFEGPPSSPYEGGIFHISMKIPTNYAFSPPKCYFMTRIYHPNIDSSGKICLDILDDISAWSPVILLDKVLISILSILDSPNIEDPLVPEIAEVYMKDRKQYNDNAALYTRKYAMHDDCKFCRELSAKRRSVPVHYSYWMSKNLHALADRSLDECLQELGIGGTTHAATSQASSCQLSPQRAAMQTIQILAGPLLRNKEAIENLKRVFDDMKTSKSSTIGNLTRINSALERSRSATHSISEPWKHQNCRIDSTSACSRHQVAESEEIEIYPTSFISRIVKELETSTEDLRSQLGK